MGQGDQREEHVGTGHQERGDPAGRADDQAGHEHTQMRVLDPPREQAVHQPQVAWLQSAKQRGIAAECRAWLTTSGG